jgi:hypothetical protein
MSGPSLATYDEITDFRPSKDETACTGNDGDVPEPERCGCDVCWGGKGGGRGLTGRGVGVGTRATGSGAPSK